MWAETVNLELGRGVLEVKATPRGVKKTQHEDLTAFSTSDLNRFQTLINTITRPDL